MSERIPGFSTLAVHAGAQPDPTTGARATPIYQTTSYVFESVDHAASLFGLQTFGNIYTRIGNPTNAVLEERVAALEGGTAGLAVASGHAAQVLVFHCLLQPGDEFVASKKLYGGSINQFNHAFKNFGWNVVWADPDDISSFERADLARRPRRSSPSRSPIPAASSPTWRRSRRSRARAGVPYIVDNTLATPYLCKPFEHGADIVVHSLTKFLGGHGNSIGGMIVDGGTFNWSRERPLSDAVRAAAGISRHRAARDVRQFRLRHRLPGAGAARHRLGARRRSTPSSSSPASRRCRCACSKHCDNALAVAEWLAAHPKVSLGELSRPARRPLSQPRQEILPERRRRGVHLRPQGRLRGRRQARLQRASCSRTSPISATRAR